MKVIGLCDACTGQPQHVTRACAKCSGRGYLIAYQAQVKMEDVRVGMRFREPLRPEMGLLTVTALTQRGFKYTSERGYSLGARHGMVTQGPHEHFGIGGVCTFDYLDAGDGEPVVS